MKKLIRGFHYLFLAALLFSIAAPNWTNAQTTTYQLTISDSTKITAITHTLNGMTVNFSNPVLNSIVSGYTITRFEKLYPHSRFGHLQNIWAVTANNTAGLISQLRSADPVLFPDARPAPVFSELFTPSDMGLHTDGYLDYIHARGAWDVTHGDPNIIIGFCEQYLDTAHEDLRYQIAQFSGIMAPPDNHGTRVAGLMAGRTDNAKGYPAIGFNCRLDYSSDAFSLSRLRDMAVDYHRPIVEASWGGDSVYSPLNTFSLYDAIEEDVCNEIYENGTFFAVSAGNGIDSSEHHYSTTSYYYPASYDHVFSVTGLGWSQTTGTVNLKGLHEKIKGDTLSTQQHNDRVDLMAPGLDMAGLSAGNSYGYAADGTSFAAPLVAGTAALMLSVHNCLTPYQLEYWLKKSANDTPLLYVPENFKYAGRLGTGLLDAERALDSVKYNPYIKPPNSPQIWNPCNDPNTLTMYLSGVEINSLCAPGFSTNGSFPQLTPVIENGKPPYVCRWEAMDKNTCTLDDSTAFQPQIVSSTAGPEGHFAHFRLTVYDNSEIRKTAKRYFSIRLRTAQSYDLALRDNYMDMMTEPDSAEWYNPRDYNIWLSPDLWVRQTADSGLEPQNPEYKINDSNEVYCRIRNVGCASYDQDPVQSNTLQLYWTKASTGERWPQDWDGTTQIGNAAGGLSPAGALIGSEIAIPSLQPGAQVVLGQSWKPNAPNFYDAGANTLAACLLARIIEYYKMSPPIGGYYPRGMTIPELSGVAVSRNVRNNNNIVTRNLIIEDVVPGNLPYPKQSIDLANAEGSAQSFDIQLISERWNNPHFSGDFSAVAYAVLRSPALYAHWVAGGELGHGFTAHAEDSSFVWSGSDELRLQNVFMNAGEHCPATLEFVLRDAVPLPPSFDFTLHLRQFISDMPADTPAYGNISFRLSVRDSAGAEGQRAAGVGSTTAPGQGFEVFPNPASTVVYIRRTEAGAMKDAGIELLGINGQLLQRKMLSSGAWITYMDVKGLPSGIYIIQIEASDGNASRYKLILK